MVWRDLPYWAKGGIIGSIIGFLFLILTNSLIMDKFIELLIDFIIFPVVMFLGVVGLCKGEFCNETSSLLYYSIIIVETFFIGAIIGFIIGKIKQEGKKRK